MIHSLAGGSFREKQVLDFAKVEIVDGIQKGDKFWYILKDRTLSVGDKVIVPLGRNNIRQNAIILRIDYSVVEGQTPVPIKLAKEIISKGEI